MRNSDREAQRTHAQKEKGREHEHKRSREGGKTEAQRNRETTYEFRGEPGKRTALTILTENIPNGQVKKWMLSITYDLLILLKN